jgi:hypothetical protein
MHARPQAIKHCNVPLGIAVLLIPDRVRQSDATGPLLPSQVLNRPLQQH